MVKFVADARRRTSSNESTNADVLTQTTADQLKHKSPLTPEGTTDSDDLDAADATEDEIADVLLAIPPWPGSAGSLPPPPMLRPRWAMTSRRAVRTKQSGLDMRAAEMLAEQR